MYSFDEKNHIHMLDGKPLIGTTTVLKVVSKGDGLIQWSANEACKYIEDALKNADSLVRLSEILKEAKTAWKGTRDKAADKGTDVHGLIEGYVKLCITKEKGVATELYHDDKMVQSFVKWAVDNKIKFLDSEKGVYSKEHWIGGIVDLVFERDGKIYVGDIKTSKSIYPTYFWQTAAYQMCLQEMGLYPKIHGHTIIKLKGGFEVQENYDYEGNKKAFLAALIIHKQLESLKK